MANGSNWVLGFVASMMLGCNLSPTWGCYRQECTSDGCKTVVYETGDPAPTQIAGDCRLDVCDGTGNFVTIADDTDLPDDGRSCTNDQCQAGFPMHVAKVDGVTCGDNYACGLANTCQAGQCVGVNSVACTPNEHCNKGTCAVKPCNGTLGFPNPPIRILGPDPTDLQPFDLNGDGKDDVAVIDGTNNMVSVVVGFGNGLFGPQADYPVGTKPIAIASDDVNQDGLEDLVVANQGDNSVSVLLNQGDGTLAPKIDYLGLTNPTFLHVTDINLDGWPDIVTSTSTPPATTILLNDASGGFAQQVNIIDSEQPVNVEVVDLNRDAKVDIAAIYGNDVVRIFYQVGPAAFSAPTTMKLQYGTKHAKAIAALDIENDGLMDLAAVGDSNGTFIEQYAFNSFSTTSTFSTGGTSYDIDAVDLNHDGYKDLILTTFGTSYALLINNGAGFDFERMQLSGAKAKQANLDGAGTLAYVVLTLPQYGSNALAEGFAVQPNMSLAHLKQYPLPIPPFTDLAVADLNGDGMSDLVSIGDGLSEDITVALRKADGTYQVQPPFDPGIRAMEVTLADINHDGTVDALLAGSPATWLLNLGDGKLSTIHSATVDIAAGRTALADFNHDGELDIAFTQLGWASPESFVGIALNTGNVTFGPPTKFPTTTDASGVFTTDFDKDGDIDVVSWNAEYGKISTATLLLNDGNGVFAAHEAAFATNVIDAIVGDLNQDGYPDIAAIGESSNLQFVLSLLFNQGNGSFAPVVALPVPVYARNMEAADFDADGALDLAISDLTRGTAIFYNPGNGMFSSAQFYTSVEDYYHYLATDLNGDQHVDVLAYGSWFPNTCIE